MRKKEQRTHDKGTMTPRLPSSDSCEACGHEEGMAVGLQGGSLTLTSTGGPVALKPSSCSACGFGGHGFGNPPSTTLSVPHVVGQIQWNLVAVCATYLEHRIGL